MLRIIKSGNVFYRARQHNKPDKIKTISDIASPPDKAARMSNRMSPAGISMFYGAFDPATAKEEARDLNNSEEIFLTVAGLSNINELQVIDFTKLPELPSMFDSVHRKSYYSILFLKTFVFELSQKIERNGMEHIDYVPTQVVTEYFRYVFPEVTGSKIDGIIYPSSRTSNGVCCVLFFDHKECINNFSLNTSFIKTEKVEYTNSANNPI